MPQPAPLGTALRSTDLTDSSENGAEPAFPKPEASRELDISDDRVDLPELDMKDLPQCPQCGKGLLRPGVVWFGEMLPEKTIRGVDEFIKASDKIDLILVIGTSAKVYPAAAYVERAREKGAKVAVVNMDRADIPGGQYALDHGDWFFEGDAAVILPELLKSEIGDLSRPMHERS